MRPIVKPGSSIEKTGEENISETVRVTKIADIIRSNFIGILLEQFQADFILMEKK